MNMTKLIAGIRMIADALEEDLFPNDAPEDPKTEHLHVKPDEAINAPSAEFLKGLLSTAAKQHGRQKITELLDGMKVAEMTEQQRAEIAIKVQTL